MSTLMDIIKKNTDACLTFLEKAPVCIPEEGKIAGPAILDPALLAEAFDGFPYGTYADNFHFPMGTAYLTYGFREISRLAEQSISPEKTPEQNENLRGIAAVYQAVSDYILRYLSELDRRLSGAAGAEQERLTEIKQNLSAIAEKKPSTFYQAIQAFYLSWRIRSALSSSTIGRLDQYLFPFYEEDIKAGRMTREDALALLCELWQKINTIVSGDTLINVMLGGSDENGNDVTNDLSVLMLEASIQTAQTEPHINVRIHKKTRADFLDAAYRLQLCGFGQAAVYNDETIIPELVRNGIPLAYACQYANDGCTEIVIDRLSAIHFDQMNAMKAFELAIYNGHSVPLPAEPVGKYWTKHGPDVTWNSPLEEGFESGDMEQAGSFDELYAMFLKQYFYHLEKILNALAARHKAMKETGIVSPFLNGSFEHLIQSGGDVLRGGLPVDCVLIFSGSFPTVADGLAAIKKVVFDEKRYTVKEIKDAMRTNFEGNEVLRQRLLRAPKFGNNDDYADSIAADLAARYFDYVNDFSRRQGLTIWPSLLSFLFVQEAYYTGATPDGRRWKDPICEHYSPTPGKALNGPTAVMNSIGKAPLSRGFGVSVVHVSLSRSLVKNDASGIDILRNLNEAALEKGFNFLDIAIYDVEKLRLAQKDPEHHGDIIVRVWGYSARFIDLSEDMQEHVIARAIHGGA